MNVNVTEKIKTAPKNPGVYIFYKGEWVLYVGKAANLRARLKSYLKVTDIKTQSLHDEADQLEYLILRSDIEALIEESKLIKSLKPKYNVVLRDDKSYSYVAISKEDFPRIFIAHKNPKVKNLKLKVELIGPFTESAPLRLVMKLLRRQFPYCTCMQKHLRDCLNAQIGKCRGFCCRKSAPFVIANEVKQSYKNVGKIAALPKIARNDRQIYRKMIRKIKMILKGQSQKLLKTLTDEKERTALEAIFAHRPYLQIDTGGQVVSSEHPAGDLARSVRYPNGKSPRVKKTFPQEKSYSVSDEPLPVGLKVECYDNSNFAGKEAVGALTALVKTETGWESDKNSYRKFIIKSAPTQDDPRMMGEVISRRLNHPEWPYPNLIIIDGGLTQFRAARAALASSKFQVESSKIKIISFAKPHKLVYGMRTNDIPTPVFELSKELRELIDRAIYQTHNFVIRFHRDKRSKLFIPKN